MSALVGLARAGIGRLVEMQKSALDKPAAGR
jgi:hypothetical protein